MVHCDHLAWFSDAEDLFWRYLLLETGPSSSGGLSTSVPTNNGVCNFQPCLLTVSIKYPMATCHLSLYLLAFPSLCTLTTFIICKLSSFFICPDPEWPCSHSVLWPFYHLLICLWGGGGRQTVSPTFKVGLNLEGIPGKCGLWLRFVPFMSPSRDFNKGRGRRCFFANRLAPLRKHFISKISRLRRDSEMQLQTDTVEVSMPLISRHTF